MKYNADGGLVDTASPSTIASVINFARKLAGLPAQFTRVDGALTAGLDGAFVVAHNAGDSLATARAAVDIGADVVEIDVISRGGALFAGHPRSAGVFSRVLLRTLPLELAWEEAARAPAVKLDLKEDSAGFVRSVQRFLADRAGTRTLIVTRYPHVIDAFASDMPHVVRFLSTPPEALACLLGDERLAASIDGVSAAPTTFDAEAVAWLRERGLLSSSSVVNTFAAADRLLALGVNGIITDNLALMRAIGGRDGADVFGRQGTDARLKPKAEL